jgi:thioredoxin 1
MPVLRVLLHLKTKLLLHASKIETMQITLIVLGFMVGIVVLLLYTAKSKLKKMPLEKDHESILTLTDQNFKQQLKNKIVLVDFWAEWCGPCRLMAPVLNEVSKELSGNKKIGKANIQQYQSLAQQFKVRSIPTLILFNNGVEVKRFVGVKSKDFLLKELSAIN